MKFIGDQYTKETQPIITTNAAPPVRAAYLLRWQIELIDILIDEVFVLNGRPEDVDPGVDVTRKGEQYLHVTGSGRVVEERALQFARDLLRQPDHVLWRKQQR